MVSVTISRLNEAAPLPATFKASEGQRGVGGIVGIEVRRSAAINLFTLWIAFLFLLVSPIFAQHSAHWKVFRVDGTYPVGISVSPRGNVVIKNADSHSITLYNGYTREEIAGPEDKNFRVYESKSGQLWSIYEQGVMLFSHGQWTYHPIPDVRAELQSNPMRAALHQPSLLPTELDHVLILLPNYLLDYDAAEKTTRVLKVAAESVLGRFSELEEGRSGVWITAQGGLAHFAGSARRISRESNWSEYPLPTDNDFGALQRPFEGIDGSVTILGLAPQKSTERFILSLKDGIWSTRKIEGEPLREAWPSWDDSLWAFSYNGFFRIPGSDPPRLLKEPGVGAHFDIATETNGVFWVASSEGFLRYAPFTWRVPTVLEGVQGPIHAFIFDRQNPKIAWLAGTEGLFEFSQGKLEHFRWPDDFETVFQPTDTIYQLRDGSLVVTAGSHSLRFRRASREFRPLFTRSQNMIVLGQFRDGALCIKTLDPTKTNSSGIFHYKDERPEPVFPSGLVTPPELGDVTFFYEALNGDFWFGGGGGLTVLREETKTFEHFSTQEGLDPERVFCLAEVGEGRILAGGMDKVFELRGRKWESALSGIDRVNMISKGSDGSPWVATASGVYHQTPDGWLRNSTDEGLPGEVIYKVRQDRSQIAWAATSHGLALYHPEADMDPPRTLEPVLQQPEAPSTVEPTQIYFRAIDKWDYTSANDLLFAWRLDEGSWSPFSSAATHAFPNLSSGKHRIEVRSMDRNGNKDPNTSTLPFSVIVPWFQDPRLLLVSLVGIAIILFFAGLAVNRHLRLKRSYAEVEKIVAQRTTELERANQELLHSQKMKAIGTMAAGIAHDFNNILSIIKGSAQIIESNVGDHEKIRTRVNRIQTVVEQGTAIVKALLGLGRLNENELVACDGMKILEETRKVLADRFPDSVTINLEGERNLPTIRCSKEVMQQMIINLVLNAVDAISNKGTVVLRASSLDTLPKDLALDPSPAPRFVGLSVTDEGAGIPAGNLPRIFEPFYTTKAFSSRRGTGLGLSMVYELAKEMGYGLEVKSELGKGSSFTIFVPVK